MTGLVSNMVDSNWGSCAGVYTSEGLTQPYGYVLVWSVRKLTAGSSLISGLQTQIQTNLQDITTPLRKLKGQDPGKVLRLLCSLTWIPILNFLMPEKALRAFRAWILTLLSLSFSISPTKLMSSVAQEEA